MGALDIQVTKQYWPYFANLLKVPQTEEEYLSLLVDLDQLLDEGGSDEENSALADLVDRIGSAIALYENKQDPEDYGTGLDALKYLMAAHNLKQTDLTELGSQGTVSEILAGKRQLTVKHIKALATRFKVEPWVFL